MKLSKKNFPFLYNRNVNWYFADDREGGEQPFSSEDYNDTLHDPKLVRDYFSIVLLEKHWKLFDEVYLYDVVQHWKKFQEHDHLFMNNEGIGLLIHYDEENDKFILVGSKEFAIVAMFSVTVLEESKMQVEIGDYYITSRLSSEKVNEFKDIALNMFRVSYAVKHFAPTEIQIVDEKNRKVRIGKGKDNKITADSGLLVPVNVIDSSYLTTIIHVNETSVRGHFRLQPCGEGMTDRKLIWIEPYQKGPYKRIAKKLKESK